MIRGFVQILTDQIGKNLIHHKLKYPPQTFYLTPWTGSADLGTTYYKQHLIQEGVRFEAEGNLVTSQLFVFTYNKGHFISSLLHSPLAQEKAEIFQ